MQRPHHRWSETIWSCFVFLLLLGASPAAAHAGLGSATAPVEGDPVPIDPSAAGLGAGDAPAGSTFPTTATGDAYAGQQGVGDAPSVSAAPHWQEDAPQLSYLLPWHDAVQPRLVTPAGSSTSSSSSPSSAASGHARIVFTCPSNADAAALPTTQQNAGVALGCPIQVYDRDDIFGQPDLGIDPNDPMRVAFAATHGPVQHSREEPTAERHGRHDRSRIYATHTTFPDDQGGVAFSQDAVTTPWFPGGFRSDQGVDPRPEGFYYGEEAEIVFGRDGSTNIGYVWSQNNATKDNITRDFFPSYPRKFDDHGGGLVGVFRTPHIDNYSIKHSYLQDQNIIDPRDPEGQMSRLSLVLAKRNATVADAIGDHLNETNDGPVWFRGLSHFGFHDPPPGRPADADNDADADAGTADGDDAEGNASQDGSTDANGTGPTRDDWRFDAERWHEIQLERLRALQRGEAPAEDSDDNTIDGEGDAGDENTTATRVPVTTPSATGADTSTMWSHADAAGLAHTAADNETGSDQAGNATNASAEPDVPRIEQERLVAVWFEDAGGEGRRHEGLTGWIDAAWADVPVDPPEGYAFDTPLYRLHEDERIGPCKDGSDAVAHDGIVYVACVVDRGYGHRMFASPGEVDVWSLDPYTGRTELISTTPLPEGRIRLATNAEGYMAMTSARVDGPDDPHLWIAFGWWGRGWHMPTRDIGGDMVYLVGGTRVKSADVTALAVSDTTRTTFMIHKVWHHESHPGTSTGDPQKDAETAEGRMRDYTKSVFALDPCALPRAGAAFQLGTTLVNRNDASHAAQPGAFNDTHDGLIQYTNPETGDELVYFAVNDYGTVQYGAVDVLAASDLCLAHPFPPLVAPTILPQALPQAAGFSNALGMAIGTVAAAMVASLLLSRRRAAHALSTEA